MKVFQNGSYTKTIKEASQFSRDAVMNDIVEENDSKMINQETESSIQPQKLELNPSDNNS